MRRLLITFFCSVLLQGCEQNKSGRVLDVVWRCPIPIHNNWDHLPTLLLKKLEKGEVSAYDSLGQKLSLEQVKRSITPNMRKPLLTYEECHIMIACGSFDFYPDVETSYSKKELKELYNQNVPLEKLFRLKYYPPLETEALDLEIEERINLDTTTNRQHGETTYLNLISKKSFLHKRKNKLICRFRYNDVKEDSTIRNAIEQRDFYISILKGDLVIRENNQNINLLSLKDSSGLFPKERLKNTVFQYFSCNILFFTSLEKSEKIEPCDE